MEGFSQDGKAGMRFKYVVSREWTRIRANEEGKMNRQGAKIAKEGVG